MKNLKYALLALLVSISIIGCVKDEVLIVEPTPVTDEYVTVVNKTVNATLGPLTSLTYPTNPIPGTDINIELVYASTANIDEARIYFYVGNTPEYVKDNKVKGEDDASFSQTGVTVNLKDIVSDVGLSLSETGAKVSFYARITDSDDKEYYYSNDGTMYLDESRAAGPIDQSDAFKGDPSLWNVYNVQ
jgi:hypothetical protein